MQERQCGGVDGWFISGQVCQGSSCIELLLLWCAASHSQTACGVPCNARMNTDHTMRHGMQHGRQHTASAEVSFGSSSLRLLSMSCSISGNRPYVLTLVLTCVLPCVLPCMSTCVLTCMQMCTKVAAGGMLHHVPDGMLCGMPQVAQHAA